LSVYCAALYSAEHPPFLLLLQIVLIYSAEITHDTWAPAARVLASALGGEAEIIATGGAADENQRGAAHEKGTVGGDKGGLVVGKGGVVSLMGRSKGVIVQASDREYVVERIGPLNLPGGEDKPPLGPYLGGTGGEGGAAIAPSAPPPPVYLRYKQVVDSFSNPNGSMNKQVWTNRYAQTGMNKQV
jgi:hypothetical protein